MADKTFYGYFKENMKGLGLPAPETLFGTLTTATATTAAIVAAVEKFGTAVTVGELIGAGSLSEVLIEIAALSAAFYVGACIGSLAVATGRYFFGGLSIGNLFVCATAHGIETPRWLGDTISTNPVLLGRGGYGTGRYPTATA
jgi:hypothetical protein